MAASVARVPVAESRLHRAVSGRLRRPPRGPLRGGSGRVRRRAVGLRGFVYFVGTHTRSTVPLGRSAAALGEDRTVAEILLPSDSSRVGKGLKRLLNAMRSYNGFRGVNRRSEPTRRLRKRVAKFVASRTRFKLPDLSSPYPCQPLVLISTAQCITGLRSKRSNMHTDLSYYLLN